MYISYKQYLYQSFDIILYKINANSINLIIKTPSPNNNINERIYKIPAIGRVVPSYSVCHFAYNFFCLLIIVSHFNIGRKAVSFTQLIKFFFDNIFTSIEPICEYCIPKMVSLVKITSLHRKNILFIRNRIHDNFCVNKKKKL